MNGARTRVIAGEFAIEVEREAFANWTWRVWAKEDDDRRQQGFGAYPLQTGYINLTKWWAIHAAKKACREMVLAQAGLPRRRVYRYRYKIERDVEAGE